MQSNILSKDTLIKSELVLVCFDLIVGWNQRTHDFLLFRLQHLTFLYYLLAVSSKPQSVKVSGTVYNAGNSLDQLSCRGHAISMQFITESG